MAGIHAHRPNYSPTYVHFFNPRRGEMGMTLSIYNQIREHPTPQINNRRTKQLTTRCPINSKKGKKSQQLQEHVEKANQTVDFNDLVEISWCPMQNCAGDASVRCSRLLQTVWFHGRTSLGQSYPSEIFVEEKIFPSSSGCRYLSTVSKRPRQL
jgi:hypothetical protein